MASCKDCVLYDVCEYADNLEYADAESLKRDCPRFQNEASFVKVVRCKDCKHKGWVQEPCHGKAIDFCKLHESCVRKSDFCSYGERKEK